MRRVHALNRTRRSYVLEEVLLHQATEGPVASSKVVIASVDPATGKAAPISDELWRAIQEFEGRGLEGPRTSRIPINGASNRCQAPGKSPRPSESLQVGFAQAKPVLQHSESVFAETA